MARIVGVAIDSRTHKFLGFIGKDGKIRKGRVRKVNPHTIGTSYFVSKSAAIRYYRPYGYENVTEAVNRKIREGEIHIGKPRTPQGARLTVIDGGKRYGIEYAS